jgi:hypothetical protein
VGLDVDTRKYECFLSHRRRGAIVFLLTHFLGCANFIKGGHRAYLGGSPLCQYDILRSRRGARKPIENFLELNMEQSQRTSWMRIYCSYLPLLYLVCNRLQVYSVRSVS